MTTAMDLGQDLCLRTISTLIATLTTVVIIAERQRRINNAKIELAAHFIESIRAEEPDCTICKDLVKELQYAEMLISQISWGHISRAAKIEDIVQITRKLAHERQKHEKLQKKDPPVDANEIRVEIKSGKFEELSAKVRMLRINFIDFLFIGNGRRPV